MATRKAIPAGLKQKMAASVVGSGASLLPGVTGTLETGASIEKDPIPSIDDLIAEQDDRETLRGLIAAQLPLNQQKRAIESQVEALNKRIKAIVSKYGIDKAVCDGASITYYPTTRSTVDPIKLMSFGVTEEVIEASTDHSTSYTLKVTGPK